MKKMEGGKIRLCFFRNILGEMRKMKKDFVISLSLDETMRSADAAEATTCR